MAARSLQILADAFGKGKIKVQMAGVLLAAGAFALLRWRAPDALSAQLAGALPGVALVLFAQYFASVRKLRPEDRPALSTAGLACLGLCIAAAAAVTSMSLAAHRGRANGTGGTAATSPAPGDQTSSGSDGSAELVLSAEDPNRVEIRPVNTRRKWRTLIVHVEKIWALTPDKAPAEPVDLSPAHDVTLLVRDTPYADENRLRPGPIAVTLQPQLPPETASEDLVDAGPDKGMVRRFKFSPQAKDYVFAIRFVLVESGGQQTDAGELLYLVDLRTSYNAPTSPANLASLREMQNRKGLRSPKLAKLLADNAKQLEAAK